MPEPTPLNAPQEPPEPDTDAEKPKDEDEEYCDEADDEGNEDE